jgi:YihY family inner membrane protein
MGAVERLDGWQQRHRLAGFSIAVVYKYVDDSGPYLAALITYYAFVSFFPLLLLFTTVLGTVLVGHPDMQQHIESSALSQLPVVGQDLARPSQLGGGTAGIVVGLLGALYGGLGIAQAGQYAMNTAWAVPRNNRPNPLKARARSLVLLTIIGLGIVGTTTLSSIGANGAGSFGAVLRVSTVLGAAVLNTAMFVFAFRIATTRSVTARQVLPGAIGAAVGWQLLQTFGVTYVTHVVRNANATNSVFALVLGLVAFLYLSAVVVLVCVEINVVRVKGLYPRALLTPFTDDVELTEGDEEAYTAQAEAQRAKGFEQIDVTFDQDTSR